MQSAFFLLTIIENKTVCVDRKLITAANSLASTKRGKLAAQALSKELNTWH